MKFYTRGWATGELTDEQFGAVSADYWRHIAALQLPPTIAALSAVNLHDARVLAVDFRPERSLVTLRLRCGDLQRGYSNVTLAYSHVALDFAALNTLRLAANAPRAEVLYDG